MWWAMNRYRRHALQLVDRLCETVGGLRIEAAGRLVEDKNTRALEDCTGNREALLLPTRQADAVFAEFSVVALRHSVIGLSPPKSNLDVVCDQPWIVSKDAPYEDLRYR